MELDAVDGVVPVLDAHDLPVLRVGDGGQALRQGGSVHGQGMVASHGRHGRAALEERAVEVAYYIIETRATVRQAAKKFGISKWWLILMMAVMVAFVGALLLLAPFETGSILVRVLGLSICIDGIMNLIVVMSTVRSIRRGREDVIDIEL